MLGAFAQTLVFIAVLAVVPLVAADDWRWGAGWGFIAINAATRETPRPLRALTKRRSGPEALMITCVVEYEIVASKIEAFERFARAWIRLVNAHGGLHHGYFLPSEGASDRALALFSFPSLAAYETYRGRFGVDPEFIAADAIRDESACVVRHVRSFMRPLLDAN